MSKSEQQDLTVQLDAVLFDPCPVWEARFHETCNPFFAWEYYLRTRNAGRPVADWFVQYLDGCASRLLTEKLSDDRFQDRHIARAFDLKAGRGSTAHHKQWIIERKHLAMALQMVSLMAQESLSKTAVAEKLAKEQKYYSGKGKSSYIKAYNRYLKYIN